MFPDPSFKMAIINIKEIRKYDVEFAALVGSFRIKHKFTDGEILLLMSVLEKAIVLKSYRDVIIDKCEKIIDEKLMENGQ